MRGAPPGREEDGAALEPGLSTVHNCTGLLEAWVGGSLLTVRKPSGEFVKHSKPGRRGKASFSWASRRRLMRTLAKVRQDALPVFVTLTYPAVWPSEASEWKRHLRNFFARITRRWPGAAGVWKLEPQKRGAPHYHLLVWGVSKSDLLSWVGKAWYQVVKSGDNRHLLAGTRVEAVRSQRGVMAYASKYLGKTIEAFEGWQDVGRFWGVFGRENMPWGVLLSVGFTYRQAVVAMRYMRRFAHLRSRSYQSLTIYCAAGRWASLLL